ncbi:MAG: hypothetical protein L0Y73_04800, partial [Candidatus Aminicenantes bacterium]|nr:hypothetical protein [Candidatus Aminicenantes bacterium]
DKEKSAGDILDLYDADPKKWKEVLLLYLGINKNREYADAILKRLAGDFKKDLEAGDATNFILFSALTQCAVPDPDTAADILNLALQCIITRGKPVKEVVDELGFIAANPRWAYAQQAKAILLLLLNKKLPDAVFQQAIFSLMHAGDRSLEKVIFKNLKRINLVEFLARLGTRDKYFIQRLFALDIPRKEKVKLIEGLKEAGNLDLLGYLLIENPDEAIKELAAYSLWRMSKLDGFYSFLDRTETGLLDESIKKEIDAVFERWGWRWDKPGTGSGKKLAMMICAFAAAWIEKNRDKIDDKGLEQVDNRFRYLATGFLVEKGKSFGEFNLIGFGNRMTAAARGLKKYWRKTIDLNRLWYKVSAAVDGDFWFFAIWMPYLIIDLIAIIGFVQYLLGFTSNGFYRFFFDSFTVQVVFFQFAISYLLSFLLNIRSKDKDDKWIYGLIGPAFFIAIAMDKIPVIRVRRMLPILFYLLAVGSLLVPFHNVIFKIVFFLYFFICGQWFFEASHIGFAWFNTRNVHDIQEFLGEGGGKEEVERVRG